MPPLTLWRPSAPSKSNSVKIFKSIKAAVLRVPHATRKGILTLLLTIVMLGAALAAALLTVSFCMKDACHDQLLSPAEALIAMQEEDYDCILVLGAGVHADGTPSAMLYDRVLVGASLYTESAPMLMSGDHTGDYNEVDAMRTLALELGVASEDIFLDHEGFSTYESLYRVKEKFGAKRIVIVSQGFHLHRALFIARELGIEAVGVPSDLRDYRLQTKYEIREVLARFKDLYVAARGTRTYEVGEPVDLSGDGSLT